MSWRDVYFLPEEVSAHDKCRDCWITIYGLVKNVTGLIEEFRNKPDLVNPILREAGQDVSYWFDLDEFKKPVLKTHLHPKTGARVPLLPFSIPHGPTFEPDTRWKPDVKTVPWWQDEKYNVGLETARPVNVRITNSLIKRSATIKVCAEDTVRRILERYSPYNPEIGGYAIKYLGRPLQKNMNLSQNGVAITHDDSVEDYVPTVMLYYRLGSTARPPAAV